MIRSIGSGAVTGFLFIVILFIDGGASAQDLPTPSPEGIVSVQGTNNTMQSVHMNGWIEASERLEFRVFRCLNTNTLTHVMRSLSLSTTH